MSKNSPPPIFTQNQHADLIRVSSLNTEDFSKSNKSNFDALGMKTRNSMINFCHIKI